VTEERGKGGGGGTRKGGKEKRERKAGERVRGRKKTRGRVDHRGV